jgi:hypothetical protein
VRENCWPENVHKMIETAASQDQRARNSVRALESVFRSFFRICRARAVSLKQRSDYSAYYSHLAHDIACEKQCVCCDGKVLVQPFLHSLTGNHTCLNQFRHDEVFYCLDDGGHSYCSH